MTFLTIDHKDEVTLHDQKEDKERTKTKTLGASE